MPPGQLSSANRLRQADATAAGVYRLSKSSLCWILGNVSKQPTRAFAERACGRCRSLPDPGAGKKPSIDGRGAIVVRQGPIGIDGSRPHRHATAVSAENDLTSGLSGKPPAAYGPYPGSSRRSRALLHPSVVSRDGTDDLLGATTLRAAAAPGNDNFGLHLTALRTWLGRDLAARKADEKFSVARPCRGRRETMVHRTPLRSARCCYDRCGARETLNSVTGEPWLRRPPACTCSRLLCHPFAR